MTLPPVLTIFTLCAIIESESSLTIALRTLRVSSMSLFSFDCSPAVIAPGARSLALTAALSGAIGVESCAIAIVPTPKSAEHSTRLNAICLNAICSFFRFKLITNTASHITDLASELRAGTSVRSFDSHAFASYAFVSSHGRR
jgi:hypothetical protein